MPVNLNALIRYKTINKCLYGGLRKYSINELIGACSDALSESRGRYTKISERTIRDDIRVMRSDILGFNAPIVQDGGLYFYSDPKYTIMAAGINDPAILQMVVKSLLKIKNDVRHPEIDRILEKLQSLSPECFEHEYRLECRLISHDNASVSRVPDMVSERISIEDVCYEPHPVQKRIMGFNHHQVRKVTWEEVMKGI